MSSTGTILIVEDEADLALLLDINLQRQGYRTLVAHNGLSACRLAAAHQPDLILLDILLPDLDGWQLCRMLKQSGEHRLAAVPVIMLSALSTPEDIEQGLALGAAAYIPKPYAIREVLQRVRELVGRSSDNGPH